MMINKLAIAVAFLFFARILSAQSVIPLYDVVPNSKPSQDTESGQTSGGILRIRDVSVPTLTVYAPTTASSRSAVIICPGGGYAILAADYEGTDVARQMANWGITAFVLKYRLPDDSIMIDRSIGPLQDAQRAIQLVRQKADSFNIDASRIGIMGFSAGGHLAATASTHFQKPVITNPRKTSVRPDFSILIYPVISMTDNLAHMGSRVNLIGKNPTPATIHNFSNELQVTSKTPPAFLVHARDDNAVKVENSTIYYEALQKNNIISELRLYDKGGHGFGLNNKTTTDQWMEHLKNWLKKNKFL